MSNSQSGVQPGPSAPKLFPLLLDLCLPCRACVPFPGFFLCPWNRTGQAGGFGGWSSLRLSFYSERYRQVGRLEANTPQRPDSGLSGRRRGALSSGLGEWGGRAEVERTVGVGEAQRPGHFRRCSEKQRGHVGSWGTGSSRFASL